MSLFKTTNKQDDNTLYIIVDEGTEEELSSTFKTKQEATDWMHKLSDDIMDNGTISVWNYQDWESYKSGF